MPEWAAGFSAFGCACADFEYRFDRQVDLPLLPDQPAAEQVQMGGLLTQAWRSLEDRVRDEFAKSGYAADDVSFTHMVRMQYYGQLVDIEVDAPTPAIESEEDVRDLIDAFEDDLHADVRTRRLLARARLPGHPGDRQGLGPDRAADAAGPARAIPARRRSRRRARSGGTTATSTTDVYEMDDVRNGHSIEGPAVLEAESTTFPIPPDRRAWLDEHGIFHLENKEA